MGGGAIDRSLKRRGGDLGLKVETFTSNSEGAIVDRIHRAGGRARALAINPAAYTHTSVAIRDAITACELPTVEVHLSNVYAREPFRHHSTIAGIVVGRIMGFCAECYLLALRAARLMIEAERAAASA